MIVEGIGGVFIVFWMIKNYVCLDDGWFFLKYVGFSCWGEGDWEISLCW